MTSRQAAYLSLLSLERNGKYSNIEIDNMIKKYNLESHEKALYTNIMYGVIERKLTLEYFLSKLSQRDLNDISLEIKTIIFIGLYQIFYLTFIPDFASVNESVELVKWAYNVKDESSKFINAILREAIRKKEDLENINIPDEIEYISIKYSISKFLASKLINQYGLEKCESFIKSYFSHPKLSLRVNTLITSTNELLCLLNENEIKCEISNEIDNCLVLIDNVPYDSLRQFEQYFFVQDVSSQICCNVFSPKPGETILDACACPGGKSFHSAMLMNNKGKIISRDLHKNKLSLIENEAKKLSIDIIETQEGSSSKDLGNITYDRIICDVPCSGFGVISKKPEIRYKKEEDVSYLPNVQYSILDNCSKYVKSGGVLVYSTCTILKEENEDVANKFLSLHPEFSLYNFKINDKLCGMKQILPSKSHDGFFIARFIRKGQI